MAADYIINIDNNRISVLNIELIFNIRQRKKFKQYIAQNLLATTYDGIQQRRP